MQGWAGENDGLLRILQGYSAVSHTTSDETESDRRGHLRFKFYPAGKSKSDQHAAAKAWFWFSPETGQHDWLFKLKLPEDFPKHYPLQFETPLSLKYLDSCLCSASFAEHAVKFSSLEDSAVKALMTTSLIIRGVARCSPGMGLVFPLCSHHTRTDLHGF